MELKDKRVLLTGATGGIGRAMATNLAARGARLVLTARRSDRLETLAGEVGAETITLAADLTRAEDRDRIAALCREKALDVAIFNAGALDFGCFDQQSPEAIEGVLQLNLLAPVLLTRALLPDLRARPEAALVFVGSTFGGIGHPGFTSYCASKFGLRGFAQSLRRELADTGVRVDYLAPRATRTELNPPGVDALNAELGNAVDPPCRVAEELLTRLSAGSGGDRHMGWPEKLFVKINGLVPTLVDKSLAARLNRIRHHATHSTDTDGG